MCDISGGGTCSNFCNFFVFKSDLNVFFYFPNIACPFASFANASFGSSQVYYVHANRLLPATHVLTTVHSVSRN